MFEGVCLTTHLLLLQLEDVCRCQIDCRVLLLLLLLLLRLQH